MSENEGYWPYVEQALEKLGSEWDDTPAFRQAFEALTARQRDLLALHFCAAEIENGGFHQLFANGTGIFAPTAAEALRKLGLPKTAALFEEAIGWFGTCFPQRWSVRQGMLVEFSRKAEADNPNAPRSEWDPFHHLGDPFYALEQEESGGLYEVANRYAQAGD